MYCVDTKLADVMRKTTSARTFFLPSMKIWSSSERMIFTEKDKIKMLLFALAMQISYPFYIIMAFLLKFFYKAWVHKIFTCIFAYSLQRSNISKNSNGCCLQIFLNIPFGSTNSFVKNIDINSASI